MKISKVVDKTKTYAGTIFVTDVSPMDLRLGPSELSPALAAAVGEQGEVREEEKKDE